MMSAPMTDIVFDRVRDVDVRIWSIRSRHLRSRFLDLEPPCSIGIDASQSSEQALELGEYLSRTGVTHRAAGCSARSQTAEDGTSRSAVSVAVDSSPSWTY